MNSKCIISRRILARIVLSITLLSRYCAGIDFPPTDCNPTPRPANSVAIFDSGVLPRLQVISGYSLFNVDNYTYFVSTFRGNESFTIGWIISNSGQVGECKPSYAICTSYSEIPIDTSIEDNWIVSSYYESDAITVYVEYLCALISSLSNTNDCRAGVNIRYYETNDANTVITAADFYSFKQAVITNNVIVIENKIYAHFNKSTKGFILGIQNNGFCTALGIFLYYYYQCPAMNDTSNLGYLPLTVAPDPSNQPIQVAFQCDNNSEYRFADCTADGSWNMPTLPVCQCLPGFSSYQVLIEYLSCVPCSVDMFKNTTENSACTDCPANSHTNGSMGQIECILYECPVMNDSSNLGYLPLTQAPDAMTGQAIQVAFICDANATSLMADCYTNGTWQILSSPVCQCLPGFSSYQASGKYLSCVPCNVDMFKATTENSTCTNCPTNSHTNGFTGQIKCIYECPAVNDTSNLGYLPLTQAPDATTGQPIQVTFICDGNATALMADCYANGTRQIPSSPVCQCRPGFRSYQVLGEYLSCVPCSVDMFKHTTGNIACTNCPTNSHTNGSTGQIECIYECQAMNDTSNLGYLPATLAPILSSQLIQVTFICDANSTSLMAECYTNGTWMLPDMPVCECNAGYKSVQLSSDYLSCSTCTNDTYKPDIGNKKCTACPTNSHTSGGTGQTECECIFGFYRATGEPINLACGTSPSVPHNLTFSRVSSMITELTLRWEDPLSLGLRNRSLLMYRVSYAKTRLPNNVTVLGMTMNNYMLLAEGILAKNTEYTLTVTSLNNLNSYSQLYNNDSITVLTTFPNILPSFDVSTKILTLAFSLDASTLIPLTITYSPINDQSTRLVHNISNCVCLGTNCICTVFLLNANLSSLSLSSTYFTESVQININPASSTNNSLLTPTNIIIVIIAIGSIILCCVICIIVLILSCYICKQYKVRISNGFANISNRKFTKDDNASIPLTMEEKLYQEPSTLYQDLNLAVRNFAKELDHSTLKFNKVIGSGEFGDVYKGTYEKYNMFISVAIKKLRDLPSKKDKEDFFREASVMGQFNHPNVIYLYGVTLTKPICIVTPFMENGSLDTFVQVYKNELSTSSLVVICSGVAAGMEYLSRIGFVHRDLSARNVLIDSDRTPKITDFGLSREMEEDCYNVKSGGKIPVRWTAPEAIAYLKFTTSSDIWSFGVLMWEILSYGSTPYEGMDNVELLRSVQTGYRLPCPDFCPVPVYELMLSCWKFNQDDRPSFRDLKHSLDTFVDSLINPSGTKRKFLPPISSQVKTVTEWLHSLRLENYYDHFEENGIHYLAQVWQLTEQDILDIGIVTISHRRRIIDSIRKTQARINLMH